MTIEGTVLVPAPAANLTLRPWDGRNNPSPPLDHKQLNLTPNETFLARLEGPQLPPGQHEFHLQFRYRHHDVYRLNAEYVVRVNRSLSQYSFDLEPVLYAGDEGNRYRIGSDSSNQTSNSSMEPRSASRESNSTPSGLDTVQVLNSTAPFEENQESSVTAASSMTTLTGKLWFLDPTGVWRECLFCHVRVWDSDSTSSDDSLGWFTTAWDGSFNFDVNNEDAWGGIDPYFVVFSRSGVDNAKAEVLEVDDTYHREETDVLYQDCPDGTCSLGRTELSTTDSSSTGWLALYTMNKAWFDLRWDNDGPQVNIGQAVATAPVDSMANHNSGTAHYHPGGEIHLGSDITSLDTMVHEYGHFSMYAGYNAGGGSWWFEPDGETCNGTHVMDIGNTRRCGWSEGWADFFPLWVWPTNDQYNHDSGTWWNLENYACYASNNDTWYADCSTRYPGLDGSGDDVEGRVASTLMDLWDSGPDNNDNDNDGYNYNFATLWDAFTQGGGDDYNLRHYCRSWDAAGYSEANFRDAALANTIDYGAGC